MAVEVLLMLSEHHKTAKSPAAIVIGTVLVAPVVTS